MGETEDERTVQASQLFENFVQMSTCKGTLQAFSILCRQLELDPMDYSNFYSSLKTAVTSWKVKALWTKLDKRAQQKVYSQNKACQGTRCLIIGGGPCGLRTAIELALLGCKVVVIEKRDTFSRNNVLHLWPFTIEDLRGLGAKKFYGKFCAGSIDHISIRQLQLMLLKICLILGIEVHVNVEFLKLVEPPEEQTDDSPSWRADIRPSSHSVSDLDFDVVIGADGRKNTLDGFSRKEFRGKLAIAITANFVNRNTTAEAKVEEISGVAFIFNQKFFLALKEETGIDLENIVYYRDNTHYFVMTAKKQSLLDKGVIIKDYVETERLLSSDNVNQEGLLSYAREAADFGTNYQLPSLDYAINHYGQPDVAMFDFTSMYASENAALIREKHGHQILVALVGDSLLEPFWPMGTGCARGFLAAFDTAWIVKAFAQGKNSLEILAERESIYRLLPQTTTENISKNFDQYTIDPATRYPNLNSSHVRPHQVRHLFIDGKQDFSHLEGTISRPVNLSRGECEVRPDRLLTWCQRQTNGYRGVDVNNLTSSWRSGLALCALIHKQRPELIDYDSLHEDEVAANNQLAFDVAERHLGIQPVTTGKEMVAGAEPDKLLMVLYLSKFYVAFRNSPGNKKGAKERDENCERQSTKSNLGQPRKRIPKDDKKLDDDSVHKRRRKGNGYLTELSCHSAPSAGMGGKVQENKVRSMATQLLAKFEENSAEKMHGKFNGSYSLEEPKRVIRSESCPTGAPNYSKECMGRKDFHSGLGGSDICHFCSKRVYVMERLSAEGFFFHRECFRCDVCNCTLRLGGHAFNSCEAKFYCKMHYTQYQSSAHLRKRKEDHNRITDLVLEKGRTPVASGIQTQPPDRPSIMRSQHDDDPGKTDMAVETIDVPCIEKPAERDVTQAKGAEVYVGHSKTKRSNCWKQRIRARFPLRFVKNFRRSWPRDKGPETVPEADSDFEEIESTEKQTASRGQASDLKHPSERSEKSKKLTACNSTSPKKRLILSLNEKEKLLSWDVLGTPEETSITIDAKTTKHRQVQAETEADKLQADSSQHGELTERQFASAASLSAFHLIANAFRRTFSVTDPSSSSIAAPTMRPGHGGQPRRRPMSEGELNFNSAEPELSTEKKARNHQAGVDLPSLLQQVSLKGRRDSGRVFSDGISSLSKRKMSLFSSLRLRKRESSETDGKDQELHKEIRMILTNLRNNASSQQSLEEPCSTDEECESTNRKVSAERQRQKQEKTVAQQAKREQLKRLHRAQVIQRQLEEVGEKQRDLEERGVALEKLIRGETGTDNQTNDEEYSQLYQSWFQLVLEKNRLVRYESDLMIFAQELELEDTQDRLQQDLRRRMNKEDTMKSASELQKEQEILSEIMRTVEKRDMLVSKLEEQRLMERAEDRDLESRVLSKGYEFHWAQANDSWESVEAGLEG
ncbi:F-actin-monooxygenase mical2b-like isoform X2 [Hippocampus zosterae]|uniref:F-actin-monooxygenase mical2b-like isoform X2 n=1 Tax=Hippocampus zosterae TaxID=109293 RepID=UPI00223E5DE9|nr:F-actin-monooxygenase mical2b-like isoform X2 [Hippocampus zosterae]